MAKHKYNDFDDSLLRQRIVVDDTFPHKQELIDCLHSYGYFNETIAERLAYVFCADNNQPRYEEVSRQMSAVIALKQYSTNRLYVKTVEKGEDILLSEESSQLFIKGVEKHVLGLLGRGKCENFEFLKQFVLNNPLPGDKEGLSFKIRALKLLAAALVDRYGSDFEYYGYIERPRFENAVQDTYDYLCKQTDLKYPWRGKELPLVGSYDDELLVLCKQAFDGSITDPKQWKLLNRWITGFCDLNARNSSLFRMLEEYKLHTYFKVENNVAREMLLPERDEKERLQVERLEKGLMLEGKVHAKKLLQHLSYQYIYYLLSGNILATEGYVPHAVAALIYDLSMIFKKTEKKEKKKTDEPDCLTAKEKHANIKRSFRINPETGLYVIGL